MSTSKAEKEKLQLIQEKSQQILSELLKDDDNKYCVDCDAKGPRWASYNIGVFLCIRCAGIHRNLGVHISRVKSVNLDSWSPEQVAYMQLMGNSKARAVYEANLPDNFRRPQVDSGLEAFVRAKYEQKKYIAKEWVQPPTPKPAFDIEEERKKEKEKKKSKIIKGQTNSSIIEVQTNPVPRPHSSPASTAINAEKVLNNNKNGSNGIKLPSTDLLGLTTSTTANTTSSSIKSSKSDDDQFDAFVSCAPISITNSTNDLVNIQQDTTKSKSNKTNEEEDFFNQKAPEQKKLDKESILKLYESSNLNQPQNNLFNLTSSTPLQPMNIATQSSTLVNGFNSVVNQNTLISNNLFPATISSTNVINNGFANFNNQPANLNQQPFLAFNQSITTNSAIPLNNNSTNPFNPFLPTPASNSNGITTTLTPSTTTNDLFSSVNLSTTLESQLNGLNLNMSDPAAATDTDTSFNWPTNSSTITSSTVNGKNHISVGQSLFSANFDNLIEKKLNGNIILPINNLSTSSASANPFIFNNLATPLQPSSNNLDILSSFSISEATNGLNVLNKKSDDLENWSSFHSAGSTNSTTTTNGLTADIWQ